MTVGRLVSHMLVLVFALFFAVTFVQLVQEGGCAAAGVFCSEEQTEDAGGHHAPSLDVPSLDIRDTGSLQRGARLYVDYCIGCHSAGLMRYDSLARGLSLDEDALNNHFRFGDDSLPAEMTSAMRLEDAREWFHQAAPPDLSLIARVRGESWLYTYMRAFYRDDSRPSGWNNAVYENVAMPHVLAPLQGEMTRDENGALVLTSEGAMSAGDYDKAVGDLVNFLSYLSEPSKAERLRAGYAVMPVLLLLVVLSYFLYRDYWRDIK